MPDDPIIIIGGDYRQAAYWARHLKVPRNEWTTEVIGRRHNDIVFVGCWWENPLMDLLTPDELCSLYDLNRREDLEAQCV